MTGGEGLGVAVQKPVRPQVFVVDLDGLCGLTLDECGGASAVST